MLITKGEINNTFLRECFDLDVETGMLTWRVRPAHHFPDAASQKDKNGRFAGKSACHLQRSRNRYRVFPAGALLAHRVVYALANDIEFQDVPKIIDHIDCNSLNNKPSNLRPSDPSQSQFNRRASKICKTGVKGVVKGNGKKPYRAHIAFRGFKVPLGTYATLEEAAAAYKDAATKLHGEFART